MKKILKRVYEKYINTPFHSQHLSLLEREIIGSCSTVLDLGCGNGSHMTRISPHLKYSLGIDTFEESLREANLKGIYSQTKVMDVRDIARNFPEESFECVVAFDLIEHLEKVEGLNLLINLERIATKKVIIFTPNGYVPQSSLHGNNFQRHLSGWTTSEMRNLGYRVVGVHGPRFLLGEMSRPRFRPSRLWLSVSVLTHPFFMRFPRAAFQLFCIKKIPPASKRRWEKF